MSSGAPEASSARSSWACVLLAAAVIALFGRALAFPFLAFDDAELILRNPEISDPLRAPLDLLLTPRVGYIVPVTVGLQAALYALGGGLAWPFHLASLLLHALYVCQLYLLLNRLRLDASLAFAAALLFAVHPLTVQPLAWAICLKDLAMANLVLLAVRALLEASEAPEPSARVRLTAVLAAVLAMLAKPTATLVGLAALAFAAALRAREPERARRVLRPALLMLLAGAAIGTASRLQHQATLGGEEGSWSPSTPFEVLGRQLLHALWPVDLLVMYPSPVQAPSVPLFVLGVVAVVIVVAVGFALRRRPEPLLLFAVALAVYAPTSNVLPFGRVISDSYMYVPLSMLFACGAWFTQPVLRARPQLSRPLAGVALGLGLALAAGTHLQLPRYRGGDALWGPVLRAHPRLSAGHIYFADELVFRGQPARAVSAYRRGFELSYDRSHLLEFGTTLALVARLTDAECMLIEAAAYGAAPAAARFNLAALLAVHREYRPRHPVIAAAILRQLDAERRAGRVAWPPALAAGLAEQLARLRGISGAGSWPQRNCALLRPATS